MDKILIFCHCQMALCKLFTFIIISVHKGQFMKFQIEDIRRGGAKILISFSSGENIILRMSAWCTSKVPVFVPTPERWQWGARVVQWWEHLPPTDVARDRIPALTAYVGWVCCWFSPFFGQVFPRVHRFSPLLKTNNSNSIWNARTHFDKSLKCYYDENFFFCFRVFLT